MPIPTGLLAYGMSGRVFHAPFLNTHPGFALRAVVERRRKAAAATYPAISSYNTVADLLADDSLELVVVNTPNDTHFALARQALAAGKHVLIEKPVATTPAELDELLALARQQQRHVLAYQNRRWDSDFQLVRQVVESGQLGQLTEVHFRFDRYKTALNSKMFKEDPAVAGSGLSYDLGPHVLDQALSLFGRPAHSRFTRASHRPGSRVDDYFHAHLEYAGNLHVFVTGSLLTAAPVPAYVLHGTLGSFQKSRADVQETQLDQGVLPTEAAYGQEPADAAGTLTLATSEPGQFVTTSLPAPTGNYTGLFEAVYQTIRHGRPFPVRPEQLRWQLEILAGGGFPGSQG
ncbi:Gfo/Idh/MocA family oxidoreductase [Hymenobacter psychrophilus]|uniref:Predicted dehydrogenase n=1 Tax=Hymenobacter psychrophilus TaxID=651662 RepID=A0A1H3IZ62_9BACT|nr:Gfo/Idh/MocA family oxidoreductase [Hymenobacter psychrophilus]SDY33043.1 Predicted dehydrogenase [Hymenobacter psychrophilus]